MWITKKMKKKQFLLSGLIVIFVNVKFVENYKNSSFIYSLKTKVINPFLYSHFLVRLVLDQFSSEFFTKARLLRISTDLSCLGFIVKLLYFLVMYKHI